MSVQYQIDRIKAGVAEAYTAAGDSGATLPSSQNVDNLAGTVRSIPSGVRLNFEVVGGTAQPSSPNENTIWVKTESEIKYVVFSPVLAGAAEGMVWITDAATTLSAPFFNALASAETYIYCMPQIVKQYINGAWVSKEAQIYQNGVWTALWNGQLYMNGNEYEDITGGWEVGNVPPGGWNTYKTATLTKTANSLVFNGRLNTLFTRNKIDVTKYSTMVFKGSVNSWSTIRVKPTRDSQENGAYNDWSAGQTERRVDISSLSGEHYVSLAVYDADNRTITLTEVYME